MTWNIKRVALAGVTALLLAGAGSLVWVRHELTRPHAGWSGETTDVMFEPGLDAGSMLEQLGRAGVLRRPGLVRGWLSWRGGAQALHAGEYRFDRPHSALEVLERLGSGDVLLHQITVPEGLDLASIAALLAQGGFGAETELRAAFSDPQPVADLDPAATDLEGYLFPDTYSFPRGEAAAGITRAMVQRFREVIGEDYLAKADAIGLDLRQAVTLASMIERETGLPEERARISRVFHNRLKRRMRLECDPTVIYALQRAERPVKRLTYNDLEFDSPWNTYRVFGLPPGPIASPGAESLLAAVQPAAGDALYFVAAPGGGHRFSDDFDSHRRAVAEWRAYSRSSR